MTSPEVKSHNKEINAQHGIDNLPFSLSGHFVAPPTNSPAPPAPEQTLKDAAEGVSSVFTDARNKVQQITPGIIVNNSVRINQGLSVAGDILNIYASDLRGLNKRSTASWISMGVSGLAMVKPFSAQSKEEFDSYKDMSTAHYIGARVWNGVKGLNPLDPHISETIGLSLIANGALYVGSAFDQKKLGQKNPFTVAVQGLITSGAGALMTFHPNVEKGWQLSSGLFYGRFLFTIPGAAYEYQNVMNSPINPKTKLPYQGNDQAIVAWAQPVRVAMQFTANCLGFLFGGAQKDANGKIFNLDNKNRAGSDKNGVLGVDPIPFTAIDSGTATQSRLKENQAIAQSA